MTSPPHSDSGYLDRYPEDNYAIPPGEPIMALDVQCPLCYTRQEYAVSAVTQRITHFECPSEDCDFTWKREEPDDD